MRRPSPAARSERQREAREHISKAIAEYDVQSVDSLIGDITPPPALMETLIARKLAEEQKKTYDAERLAPYERHMIERFGPRAQQPSILDLLPDWMLRGLAGQLFGARWFARRFVLDDWFFHMQQPPLDADERLARGVTQRAASVSP